MILREDNERFVLFLWGEDKTVPVKFVRCMNNTKQGALSFVGRKLFHTMEGLAGWKVKRLYDLGVDRVQLTEADCGRIVYEASILDYLKLYGAEKVYQAWLDDFSDYDII